METPPEGLETSAVTMGSMDVAETPAKPEEVDPVESVRKQTLPLLVQLLTEFTAEYREEDKPEFSAEGMRSKYRIEWFTNVFDMINGALSQVRGPLHTELASYCAAAIARIHSHWDEPRTLEEVQQADFMLNKLCEYIETEM